MSVLETVLVFAVIPAVVYGAVMLLTLWPKFTRARYRPGQDWNYPPVWWVADPSTLEPADVTTEESGAGEKTVTAQGGARGSW